MTISEALAAWLLRSGLFTGASTISVDALGPEEGALALFASESGSVPFLDGSREVSCRFLLALRCASQTDGLRRRARALLESLAAWVRQEDMLGALPDLGEGRICLTAAAEGPGSVRDRTDAQTVYQLPIRITYWEG